MKLCPMPLMFVFIISAWMNPKISMIQSGSRGYSRNNETKYAQCRTAAAAGTASHLVWANILELVTGRSVRIASAEVMGSKLGRCDRYCSSKSASLQEAAFLVGNVTGRA